MGKMVGGWRGQREEKIDGGKLQRQETDIDGRVYGQGKKRLVKCKD